jgi:virginiamycin A acetyltransferase
VRELVKKASHLLATILILPLLILYRLKSCLHKKDAALCDTTELLALLPGLSGKYLRNAFLRFTIEFCHPSARIGFGTTFSKVGTRIEANVYIGSYCTIGLATIGKDALIANGVYIPSGAHQHGLEDASCSISLQPGVYQRVTVGKGSWIGCHAVIMADVGKGAVVAAGAVVDKPIPDFAIAGGVPARVLKSRHPASSPSA